MDKKNVSLELDHESEPDFCSPGRDSECKVLGFAFTVIGRDIVVTSFSRQTCIHSYIINRDDVNICVICTADIFRLFKPHACVLNVILCFSCDLLRASMWECFNL